jgi:hypothetical protein
MEPEKFTILETSIKLFLEHGSFKKVIFLKNQGYQ